MIKRTLTAIKIHVFSFYLHYLSLGFLVILCICVSGKRFGFLNTDQIIGVAGSGMTFLAIAFAGFQFKANHDWNRRHSAIIAAKEIRKSVYDDIDLIDKTFGFSNRRKHETISVDEIHKKICLRDEGGNGLKRKDDGKLLLDHDSGGADIARAIKNYLGSFEYLAAGIRQGVLDEELIYTLYGGPMIRAACIFEKYIDHVNNDMYPGRNGKIYCNLKRIRKKFEERESLQTEGQLKKERPAPG